MNYRPFVVVFVIFIVLASGCDSLTIEEIANTSVAQTRTARSPRERTGTVLPPTLTASTKAASPSPSETPVPPTVTSTTTLSPTPDLRVIDQDPRQFLMEEEDLPSEPNYYLPSSNWISPHRNYEVISELGTEVGEEYINRTGRLDGWWVTYRKGASRIQAPDEIYHNIVKYETAAGAKLTVREYNLATRSDEYQILDQGIEFGDANVVMVAEDVLSDGTQQITYRIETAYRNFVSVVVATGSEGEIDFPFVETIARKMIEKLGEAPLDSPQD